MKLTKKIMKIAIATILIMMGIVTATVTCLISFGVIK